jgi:hypothetical protein
MNVWQAAPAREIAGDERRPQAWRRLDGSTVVIVVVALLTAVGAFLRIEVARQSFFGDELATYWLITTRGLGGLISALFATHDEITPPLFFVAAWFTAHLGHSPLLIRLPSLLSGVLTIPAVYLLGRRTVGRPAALLACALCSLSPFMIYYSAEARAYGLVILLVTVSTLALLRALDTGDTRWWVAYAVCAAGAFYTHYTSGFYLVGQVGWALWAHPEARRKIVIASLGAVALVAPWAPAVLSAAKSPTTAIMSALAPFTLSAIGHYLEHWAVGYPYTAAAGLNKLPGIVALALLGLAVLLTAIGLGLRFRRLPAEVALRHARSGSGLIVVLLVTVVFGEAIVSLLSTHVFGVRNLGSAWPVFALSAGAAAMAAGQNLRLPISLLVVACFVVGGARMLEARFQRPDYEASAAFVNRIARPGDVVIDDTRAALTPGPLTGLDVFLRAPVPVFRAGVPQEAQHPFGFSDLVVPLSSAIQEATAAAGRGRVIIVSAIPTGQDYARSAARRAPLPSRYQVLTSRVNPGIVGTSVQVYGLAAR